MSKTMFEHEMEFTSHSTHKESFSRLRIAPSPTCTTSGNKLAK